MYKSRFTLSDDHEEYEGYTDGSLWNGWANVFFTIEQMKEFLNSLPYDYKIEKDGEVQVLLIQWESNEAADSYLSTPIPTDDGEILEGFALEGLEFMEVTDEAN